MRCANCRRTECPLENGKCFKPELHCMSGQRCFLGCPIKLSVLCCSRSVTAAKEQEEIIINAPSEDRKYSKVVRIGQRDFLFTPIVNRVPKHAKSIAVYSRMYLQTLLPSSHGKVRCALWKEFEWQTNAIFFQGGKPRTSEHKCANLCHFYLEGFLLQVPLIRANAVFECRAIKIQWSKVNKLIMITNHGTRFFFGICLRIRV